MSNSLVDMSTLDGDGIQAAAVLVEALRDASDSEAIGTAGVRKFGLNTAGICRYVEVFYSSS